MSECSRAHLVARRRSPLSAFLFTLLLGLASLGSPDPVNAAGLGRLTVLSVQGQPFKAEIDLIAIKKDEKPVLTARLASQDAFRQASVDYLPVLSTFYASIETRTNGSPYVRIVSPQAISEPLLNILVELNWPSGRLLREYTVVLPYRESDSNGAAKHASPASTAPPAAKVELADRDSAARRDASELQQAEPASGADMGSEFYEPVKQGATLAGIAKNLIESSGGTGTRLNQALIALHRANPRAFIADNIHQLKAGTTLRIPDRAEIAAIPVAEADRAVQLHTADWRQRRIGAVAEAPAELRQTVTGTIDRRAEPVAGSEQEPTREVLRLSKGAEHGSASGPQDQETAILAAGTSYPASPAGARSSPHSRPPEQLQAMEEDATARTRALREANERIALLEKNIRELQRLLELKNVALAEMQKRAESIQANVASGQEESEIEGEKAQAEAATAGGNVQEAMDRQSFKNAEADVSEPANGTRVPQVAASESPVSDPSFPERVELARPAQLARLGQDTGARGTGSILEDLMANFEYLGGALVLLLTGIVGVSMVRGSRSSSVFDAHENLVTASAPALLPARNEHRAITGPVAGEGGSPPESNDVPDSRPSPEGNGVRKDVAVAEAQAVTEAALEAEVKQVGKRESEPLPELPVTSSLRFAQKIGPDEHEAERDPHWHEIVTKLDLARAYQEMGDKESAGEILQEVIREGDQRQREYASMILKRL